MVLWVLRVIIFWQPISNKKRSRQALTTSPFKESARFGEELLLNGVTRCLFFCITRRAPNKNQHALENERNIVQEPIFFPSGVRCSERFPRNKRNTSARVACSMNIYEAFFFSIARRAASALCGLPDFWECSLAGYQLPGCISRSLKCHCRKRSYSGSIGLMLCVRLQQFFCCCRF